jgi:hypothetical protein
MRLALKAQSQCRATLEALANIKNPPVVIARQANFAAGPQQVNNSVNRAARAHAGENHEIDNQPHAPETARSVASPDRTPLLSHEQEIPLPMQGTSREGMAGVPNARRVEG